LDRHYRIGVDIGGTFTDIIVFDRRNNTIVSFLKVSSTPRRPEIAVIDTLRKMNFKKTEVETIIHATTIATNALLGQVGLELPKAALITTKGFRDILEIGRQRRPDLYNLFVQRPRVLIPRKYRFEADERLDYEGNVIKPLNEDEIREIARKLSVEKIETVAISLLHSYANSIHEVKIQKILKKIIPNIFISLSSEVDPEHREYERTSTTVVNAILMPIVTRYLQNLSEGISSITDAPIRVMKSSGGVASIDEISRLPVSIIESGPAAGVLASMNLGSLLGKKNVLSFDMGGTTAKAGTVIDGTPIITTEYEVCGKIHAGRIIKGSGYPVRFPFIDVAEISAGGGSIIWVDEGGALRVGPISAGADPGPACYGKGGDNPTITDANLILGRLNQKYLLGGEMRIFPEKAKQAFYEKITNKLDLDLESAAIGSIKITNAIMSKILRIVSIERGIDPRNLTLISFGGAGPMHACDLAEDLEMNEIVIPLVPGLFSAFGLLATDFKHVFTKSIRKIIDELDPIEIEEEYQKLERKGFDLLRREGVPSERIVFNRYADMRYWGQGFELLIPIGKLEGDSAFSTLKERFNEFHERRYGYSMPEEDIEIVNLRVEAIGIVEKPVLQKIRTNYRTIDSALIEYRNVYFGTIDDFTKTPVYDRKKIPVGAEIQGPAIIEQYDSTTVVNPGWVCKIDSYGNLILRRG